MRSSEQGHPQARATEALRVARPAPARVVVLAEWRAAHRARSEDGGRRARCSVWLAIAAALLVLGPPAISSLVRHRVGPAEAAAAVNEITFGD
jgi:hypothetical protein